MTTQKLEAERDALRAEVAARKRGIEEVVKQMHLAHAERDEAIRQHKLAEAEAMNMHLVNRCIAGENDQLHADLALLTSHDAIPGERMDHVREISQLRGDLDARYSEYRILSDHAEQIEAELESANKRAEKADAELRQSLAIARAAKEVTALCWGTSCTESYHNMRIAAMDRLRAELEGK